MLNTRQSAQFLGVKKEAFSTHIVPVICHLRERWLQENVWFYKEEDLIKIKPFLKQYACGRVAARAIKQFLDEEKNGKC